MSAIETISSHCCHLRSRFLDLLFPPRCVGCGRVGTWLCAGCLEQIQRVEPPICTCCGDAVATAGLCMRCRTSPLQIECIRSVVCLETVLREAVHALKYNGRTVLAGPLGALMASYWMENSLPADVIVPVPLHVARLHERGYNQSALLAHEVARRVGLMVDERTLIRQRATSPQVELNAVQRKENVRDAFHCSGNGLVGRQVLLVDDVCTTGATLEACAVALHNEGGVRGVRALTLARPRH